jgi:hypothetical protein
MDPSGQVLARESEHVVDGFPVDFGRGGPERDRETEAEYESSKNGESFHGDTSLKTGFLDRNDA